MNLPSLLMLLFMSCFCSQALWGQEPDSVVADSTVLDSLISLPKEAAESELPPEWADSLLRAELALLKHEFDSMCLANQRLKVAARRRLTMDIYVDSFRSYLFHSCAIDPRKVQLALFNKIDRKRVHDFSSVAALAREQGDSLVFAMNAGMYLRNRRAKGLLIVDGHEQQALDPDTLGYGNFYMQPNGVFALDSTGDAFVVTTQAYPALADTQRIRWATQSGPMLLVAGEINAHFNDGSPNRHIRNAVGVTADNEVVFAISARPVTFFELSSFMIRQGCTDALYLDGAISQAYLPQLGIGSLASGAGLGPIFVILTPQ